MRPRVKARSPCCASGSIWTCQVLQRWSISPCVVPVREDHVRSAFFIPCLDMFKSPPTMPLPDTLSKKYSMVCSRARAVYPRPLNDRARPQDTCLKVNGGFATLVNDLFQPFVHVLSAVLVLKARAVPEVRV